MSRILHPFHGGIRPPEHKRHSNGSRIGSLPLPSQLVLSLRQHIGQPARPIVVPGDTVLKGQTLAVPEGRISSALHAPTSGRIVAIEPRSVPHPSGLTELCVVLVPDGQERWVERMPFDWRTAGIEAVAQQLCAMGVVGLGGAGFPTHLKLGSGRGIETLVINGAECEPYITCDDRLMRERAADLVAGIQILRTLLRAQTVLVGVEDNKPEAIEALQLACGGADIEVVALPTRYPSGGAKQLIRLLTGLEVPAGTRATELGVQCFNVGTVYALYRALEHGEPLISRIVTLTGAVARPGNVEALLGTPLDALMQHAGADDGVEGYLYGGPMMGFALPSLAAGLTKSGNCIVAKSPALFPPAPPPMPCIRCGDCAQVCPAELQPMDLYWFARARQFDRARERHLFDCIECGACAYVCPSHIPLVDYYRHAKAELWAADAAGQAADLARRRHQARQRRLEAAQQARAERRSPHAAPVPAVTSPAPVVLPPPQTDAPAPLDEKQARIAAALARAAARRDGAGQPPAAASAQPVADEAQPVADEKQARIEAAMARAAQRRAAQESRR
ncbi:electron transport complex subunit RsxC [Chitiniphilus purpureus]|uniref:Ion-translocating oxidoreductase complex subunit C n=1 Tax=Chitiniphilus purpureus TaxID=2981137 RepID=A0ABY6DH06_9NEIS|nr:electron transport complex subunit RsxC [Chitiniphilus sp. CD1]UXY13635.1 electron transport complex subunit RsxC [Chitiniphilus sp. CD1]